MNCCCSRSLGGKPQADWLFHSPEYCSSKAPDCSCTNFSHVPGCKNYVAPCLFCQAHGCNETCEDAITDVLLDVIANRPGYRQRVQRTLDSIKFNKG